MGKALRQKRQVGQSNFPHHPVQRLPDGRKERSKPCCIVVIDIALGIDLRKIHSSLTSLLPDRLAISQVWDEGRYDKMEGPTEKKYMIKLHQDLEKGGGALRTIFHFGNKISTTRVGKY